MAMGDGTPGGHHMVREGGTIRYGSECSVEAVMVEEVRGIAWMALCVCTGHKEFMGTCECATQPRCKPDLLWRDGCDGGGG